MADHRLFFALWPDEDVRERLARQAAEWLPPSGGRLIEAANLHLTLAFLGGVPPATRRCLEEGAQAVRARRFDLCLEELGHWVRSGILWSAPRSVPRPLAELVEGLRGAQARCGLVPEERRFAAHVTVARRVPGRVARAAHPAIEWAVRDFCLVRSRRMARGVRYEPIRRFPLGSFP